MNLAERTPTSQRLLDLTEGMTDQPVAMLADLVADRFITGTPKRLSREAPVLILRWEGETLIPGGGANAIANVAALGGQPLVVGVVGDDLSGSQLLAELARRGVNTSGVLCKPGYSTPTKTRILGGGRHAIKQQIVRYDIEQDLRLGNEERQRLISSMAFWQQRPRVAVLSDYGYGTVVPELIETLRQHLHPEALVLVDSRYRLADFAGMDGATPNLEEAEQLLGHGLEEVGEDLEREGEELRRRLGARFLLITRGSAGMSLFTADASAHLPVHGTDQVADVTGAGDTVIGTFALALAAGASTLEATCLANYAGGVVVMKAGTATLDREELCTAIQADPRPLEELQWGG